MDKRELFQNEIKSIKDANTKNTIEKAKCEERISSLNDQKEKVEKQCAELDIKPEDLPETTKQMGQKILDAIAAAKEKLGIAMPVAGDQAANAEEESPF